jgi:hypothetical protein
VEAHIEPALRLGQAIARDPVLARVVEGSDASLLCFVAFVVGIDRVVGDARSRRVERLRADAGGAEQSGGQQGREEQSRVQAMRRHDDSVE